MRIILIFCLLTVAMPCFASPPQSIVSVRPVDVINLAEVDPSIRITMMYASSDNFTGAPIDGYKANICYLTSKATEALKNAQRRIRKWGRERGRDLTLLVRDCYRPYKAVRQFVQWASAPDDAAMKRAFYPDLSKAQLIEQNYISPVSGHSRASSVDLTLAEINPDGQAVPLPMGTPIDFFGIASHTDFPDISLEQKQNRALLGTVMAPEFKNYAKEWWHFALKTEPYPSTFFDFDIAPRIERTRRQSVITTEVSQAAILAELDRDNSSPLSLEALLKAILVEQKLALPAAVAKGPTRASDLLRFNGTYGEVVSVMSSDVARMTAELGVDWEKEILKTYDPKSARTEIGKTFRLNGNVMRVFNTKWLGSKDGMYILAGVVNRIDRRNFDPAHCGELRLIYRLGYEVQLNGKTYASRMPFSVNMVFSYKNDGRNCTDVASLWRIDGMDADGPAAIAARLLARPLDFSRLTFKQVEVNAQVARFPSDLENVEDRKFAGQAIYLMRIFTLKNGKLQPARLENTPDVEAILNDPARQQLLEDYLSRHMSEIDNGVFNLPETLEADIALSVSTAGSARLANRPFDLLIKKERADRIVAESRLSESSPKFVTSGVGLLERLNTSTCMGCHQASSTAGFHFLGEDRFDFGRNPTAIRAALDGNILQLPFSPHVYAELERRRDYVERLSLGEAPNTFRPHPSAPKASWANAEPAYEPAGDNMPCPLNTDTASASSWKCNSASNLSCQALVKNKSVSSALGQCVPPAQDLHAGLSCRSNVIDDSTIRNDSKKLLSFNLQSFRDRVSKDELLYNQPEGKMSGYDYNCRPTKIGVPLGRVTRRCKPEELNLTAIQPGKISDEICAVVGGKGFEQMAKGYFDSEAFAAGVGRGLLNTCSPSKFCREDYICQQMPEFLTQKFGVSAQTLSTLKSQKIGFCTPTYFVYQMRLDGHPEPN